MNKRLASLFVLSSVFLSVYSQILHPSIGIGAVPSDSDPICSIPLYLGSFYTSGKQAGDTAADFTIYDLNGNPFNLSTELAKGKPVLLVAGNYTCPVFRNKIPSINNVINTYSAQVTTVIYYGVEAHPTDTSPYFGYINTGSANISAGILYAQPTTYGQRKQVITDMLNDPSIPLLAPVYIDGPCNNLWAYYGPAPNNAYLIDTNGIIFSKHGWYDKYPDNIICSIDSLLGNPTSCGPVNNNGTFTYKLLSSSKVYGNPGATLSIDAELINNSSQNALVLLRRMQNDTAQGWASSMCADVCYSTNTDTVTILIAPGDTQDFHFYFYTNAAGPDSSHARMRFRNVNNSNNLFTADYYGITNNSIGINEEYISKDWVRIFPIPSNELLFVNTNFPIAEFIITDLSGKLILNTKSSPIHIQDLDKGLYLLKAQGKKGEISTTRFIR